jgi:hypothetical protein
MPRLADWDHAVHEIAGLKLSGQPNLRPSALFDSQLIQSTVATGAMRTLLATDPIKFRRQSGCAKRQMMCSRQLSIL